MNILFFPSDQGGGFGHISRCLVLAQEARTKGHTCVFVLSSPRYEKLVARYFPVFVAKRYRRHIDWWALLLATKQKMASAKKPAALFTGFSTMDYQVVRDGLIDERILEHTLRQYLEAMHRFKPDLVIGDTNLMARIVAIKTILPIVQVVRYATHPDTDNIIWWDNKSDMMEPPDSLQLFDPWFKKKGLDSITKVGDLLRGDLYLVPSIPELEPTPPDAQTMHVGQLSIAAHNESIPGWLQEINNSLPLIYVTIGGGAGQVGNKLFFQTVIEAFKDKPVRVIVSTSDRFNKHDFPNLPNNILMFPWVPGKHVISKADLVIFHGGYGSMMECVSYGKPSIVVPFHTEQEGNGRRLEQLGCSLVLKLSHEQPKHIEGKWKYGKFTFSVQNRYDLTAEELFGSAHKVLYDIKYRNNAFLLKSKTESYGGPIMAMELIEKRWG
jgi:UDP:flavonoid glycosyltransferase YjiC (YdhE family)